GVDLATLRYTAVGMNHMTWFTEVRVNGQDAMPRLHDVAKHKIAEAAEGKVDNPFSWQMLQLFGAFPAVLDRHVTEFFPQLFATGEYGIGAAERKTLGVDVFSLEETIAYGDRIYAQMKEDALSQEPLPADYFERVGGEHEQVVEIIDSIRRDTGRIYSVNLPNTGQVPNLPMDAIIEAPAVAEANGLRAITQPELPVGIVGTLATRLAWVETVVEAALEGSRDTFVQALILDGAVRSVQMAEELADELLAAHAAYLPQFA
ncbi:MAG: hypothetical protein GX552_17790, partial [Chloroflexi bacterium]|nr:hypothetical protein [Chloroflexota bacterium]